MPPHLPHVLEGCLCQPGQPDEREVGPAQRVDRVVVRVHHDVPPPGVDVEPLHRRAPGAPRVRVLPGVELPQHHLHHVGVLGHLVGAVRRRHHVAPVDEGAAAEVHVAAAPAEAPARAEAAPDAVAKQGKEGELSSLRLKNSCKIERRLLTR